MSAKASSSGSADLGGTGLDLKKVLELFCGRCRGDLMSGVRGCPAKAFEDFCLLDGVVLFLAFLLLGPVTEGNGARVGGPVSQVRVLR